MVDPKNIPALMTGEQLEWWILFGICVAGKSAEQTKKKLNTLLDEMREIMRSRNIFGKLSPFYLVRQMAVERRLPTLLQKYKLGQYARIEKAMTYASVNLDVNRLTLDDLESVPGIGPKTARMVMLYSDSKFNGVPLDTHILKYLALMCPNTVVPKSTPPAGLHYRELEQLFQELARRQKKTVRELDTLVWKAYQSGNLSQLPGGSS